MLSILIGLSSIGQLSLLRERFSEGVLVPPAYVGKKSWSKVGNDQEAEKWLKPIGSLFTM